VGAGEGLPLGLETMLPGRPPWRSLHKRDAAVAAREQVANAAEPSQGAATHKVGELTLKRTAYRR
jgi:hypothetical protein